MLGIVACGETSTSGAGGMVTDSAGVRIVQLPPATTISSRSLELDRSWIRDFELEVGHLGDVEPLPRGGAVVLDEMGGTISVLGPSGELLVEFGQLGEGPGEFSPHGGISRLVATDTSLLVPDIQLQRTTEFSMDGEVLAIHPFPELDPAHGPVYGVEWRGHPEGGVVFRALVPEGDVIVWARDRTVDTLHHFQLPSSGPNALLPPTPVWDVGPDGRVVVGRSDQGRIEARMPGSESPHWTVHWPTEVREVSPGERDHLEGLMLASAEEQGLGGLPAAERERILASVTLPESAPVIASVLIDPRGGVWVQEADSIPGMGREALRVGRAAGFGGDRWWVLGADGLAEEVVTMPRGFSPRRFSGDCLYGILEDELGVQRPARVCR